MPGGLAGGYVLQIRWNREHLMHHPEISSTVWQREETRTDNLSLLTDEADVCAGKRAKPGLASGSVLRSPYIVHGQG